MKPWAHHLRLTFQHWRRALKSKLPYVPRREYRRLRRQFDQLALALTAGARPASRARLTVVKGFEAPCERELCLFVSHMPSPTLKPHVREHIQHLQRAGIAVMLVVNTDLDHGDIVLDDELVRDLAGCCVRENSGFDFAAWAHALSLLPPQAAPPLLYFVNDSIAGPLNSQRFESIIARLRSVDADVIGLTECTMPQPHLQSYFLAFRRRVVESEAFKAMFRDVLSLPTKELVIDVYETRLTQYLEAQGFRWRPVIPTLTSRPYEHNDTHYRWAELLDHGFPYVKVSVLRDFKSDPRIARLIPERFRRIDSA